MGRRMGVVIGGVDGRRFAMPKDYAARFSSVMEKDAKHVSYVYGLHVRDSGLNFDA